MSLFSKKKREKKEKESGQQQDWQIYSIEVDKVSSEITDFFEQHFGSITQKNVQLDHFVNKEQIKKKTEKLFKKYLREKPAERKKVLTVYGSGHFHHLTYGLCSLIEKEYGYIHFDHHTDGYTNYNLNDKACREVSCGSFVSGIRMGAKCKGCFLIGSDSFYCDEMRESITKGDLEERLEEGLKKLPNNVYLSFDLDVMSYNDITTDFGQGSLRADELLEIIDFIQKRKSVIGADILGLAGKPYLMIKKDKPDMHKRGKLLYGVIACKLLGKDYKALKEEFDSTYC